MQTKKGQKVELIAAAESDSHLNCVHLDVEGACLVATNGHMLVKVPVLVDDQDTTGPVEISALKEARRLSRDETVTIGVSGEHILASGVTYPRKDRGDFPPYEKVIPDFDVRTTITVVFDAFNLLEICKALGGAKRSKNYPNSGIVRMTIIVDSDGKPDLDPIKIDRVEAGAEGLGVLMPVRL